MLAVSETLSMEKKQTNATTVKKRPPAIKGEFSNGVKKMDVYNTDGKKVGSVDLSEKLFGLPWNDALMHQVVVGMQANARAHIAHTKNRGEVAGGGKKPWRQKGTGRARHGSIRSPIWRGGGVTFGPRNEKSYSVKINKNMRKKALFVALSRAVKEGRVLFVDSINISGPKTSDALGLLKAFSSIKGFEELLGRRKNSAFIALPRPDEAVSKSFSNFGNIELDEIRNLNPVDVLSHKFLVVVDPKAAISALEARAQREESRAKQLAETAN